MLWVIYNVDKPGMQATRMEVMAEHKKYLDSVESQIAFSGPQEKDDGSEMLGSLYILNVESRAQAQAFVENEPFFRAGVFESITIRRLRKGRFHPESMV